MRQKFFGVNKKDLRPLRIEDHLLKLPDFHKFNQINKFYILRFKVKSTAPKLKIEKIKALLLVIV